MAPHSVYVVTFSDLRTGRSKESAPRASEIRMRSIEAFTLVQNKVLSLDSNANAQFDPRSASRIMYKGESISDYDTFQTTLEYGGRFRCETTDFYAEIQHVEVPCDNNEKIIDAIAMLTSSFKQLTENQARLTKLIDARQGHYPY